MQKENINIDHLIDLDGVQDTIEELATELARQYAKQGRDVRFITGELIMRNINKPNAQKLAEWAVKVTEGERVA